MEKNVTLEPLSVPCILQASFQISIKTIVKDRHCEVWLELVTLHYVVDFVDKEDEEKALNVLLLNVVNVVALLLRNDEPKANVM